VASTFPGVIAFAFAAVMLLVGTVMRARVRLLQAGLVPASLIGGVVGFALVSFDFSFGFSASDFTAFTFHCFTLSFMSLCLTGSAHGGRQVAWGGSWLAVVWVMSLALQALAGLLVILAFNEVSAEPLSPFLGLLVTHGFTQGPGQALALGTIWENELGIADAINFGLVYASAGFIVAFAVGVPVARWAMRRGLNHNTNARLDAEFLRGLYTQRDISTGSMVTHSANVDTLAYHIGILGFAYLLTDTWLNFVAPWTDGVTVGPVPIHIIFSHNLFFLHGLIVCLLLRTAIDRAGLGHMIDDETQRRITGSAVDMMVVTTIMSIQFAFLAAFLIPIVLVCLAATASTAGLCFVFGKRLAHLGIERALTVFGCCTGSTGTGILLLRILDPDLSGPIAKELAFFNIAILVLGFHILTVMAPILPALALSTIGLVYVGTLIAGAVILWAMTKREN
jgi:ESS family glutamate:Na+ symporter